MYSKYISPNPRAVVQRSYDGSRLNWLIASNEYEARRRRLFRNASEEEQLLLMRHPISAEKAYRLAGLLLGALPPAAIFARLFGYGLGGGYLNMNPAEGAIFLLCAVMNLMCCAMGYLIGLSWSSKALKLERGSWVRMLLLMPLFGAAWGAVSGLAGGFIFFGIGAFFGAGFGIAVGSFGFLIFAIIHRSLERGGMIEARHFVPLACGITAIITVLIWRF